MKLYELSSLLHLVNSVGSCGGRRYSEKEPSCGGQTVSSKEDPGVSSSSQAKNKAPSPFHSSSSVEAGEERFSSWKNTDGDTTITTCLSSAASIQEKQRILPYTEQTKFGSGTTGVPETSES